MFPLCDASKVPACACCERRMAEDAELLPVYDPALKSLKVNGELSTLYRLSTARLSLLHRFRLPSQRLRLRIDVGAR